ncbi:MAG: DUF1416 domain-containing protein [Patescibacteria group bacterium]|nr:DUF1416 domain-containing protein [Patescibacteria group bacterium]MDD5715507.1 DUF1416 domain-containing protein [Patescibacteria group bacterium]
MRMYERVTKMKKAILWCAGCVASIALVFIAALPAQATTPVSLSDIEATSTHAGATNVTWTATMTVNTAIPADSNLTFGFQGNCPMGQGFDLSNAEVAISGASGVSNNANDGDFVSPERVNFFVGEPGISTGVKTVTITGVRNVSYTGMYYLGVEVRFPDTEGPGQQITASSATVVGDVAVMGRVKMPDYTPVSQDDGVGVNIRTENYSFNYGTGVDQNGYYIIPVQTQNGLIAEGQQYLLEAWVGNAEGVVSPDPVPFVYSGSMVTKNIVLVAAKKTLNVTVTYDDGAPVTLANVWANKRSGGGGNGKDVGEDGTASLSIAGGSYDVNISCPWDPELNAPGDCDWAYNQPPMSVDFKDDSSIETKEVAFVVAKATAKIKGVVNLPNGDPLQNGYVEIQSGGSGSGAGSGISQSGSFSASVKAGTYIIRIWPDSQNPALAKYYSDEISVTVADEQTKNLGTIVMKEKTSVIKGTVIDEGGQGVSGVWVSTWQSSGSGWSNTESDASGKFTLYVSAGEWQINIDQGRSSSEEGPRYIPLTNRPVAVSIEDDETVSGVTLEVKAADATVNVFIVDANGNAISNMYGYAYARIGEGKGAGGNEFGGSIDRGTASIALLGGETYTVGVNTPPDANFAYSVEKEVQVTVDVGQTKSVKVTLVPNDATIRGYVKDQNGKLVQGVDAEVFVLDENWQWRGTQLNGDGSFLITVLGGKKYMVGAHVFKEGGSSQYIESNPEPGDSFYIGEDQTLTKVITLMKADTYIEGTVVDPDGNPVPYAWVGADNRRSLENKLKADTEGSKVINSGTESGADGKFRINVVSGDYEVYAGMPPGLGDNFMPPESQSVSVTAGSPAKGITMRFREADAYVNAIALMPDGTKPQWGFCHAWSENQGFSGEELLDGEARIPLTAGTWYIGCDTDTKAEGFFRSPETTVVVATGDSVDKTFQLEEAQFVIPEGYTETFDATAQKTFTFPDGTILTVPAGALATEGNVTLMAEPDTNLMFTSDTKPINFAWNFEALDSNNSLIQTFNSSVSICIPYDIAYLEEMGVDENDIIAKYYSATAGAWQLPDGVTQDFDNHMVCFSVTHFTNFAITTGGQFGAAAGSGPAYVVATPASNGGPQVTAWDGEGNMMLNFFAYASTLRIGVQALAGDVDGDGENEIIVAPGAGAGPQIRIFNLRGQLESQFFAFATNIRTGVILAVADVNGDGVDEIITTTMAGAGPQVRVFNAAGEVVSQFFAYATSFRGGVQLATGDVDGDGIEEIITIPQQASAPHVRVFDYDGTVVSQFFAYASTIRGSYHLSTGDVNADGVADVIVTPGPGLGPQVAMFTGSGELIGRFFAYATTFRGGMHASVGDVNGDGANEIVASPESNAGPHIRVFNTAGAVVSQFFAYAQNLRGSFSSVVADVDSDGTSDIVTAPGSGMGPHVRAFDGAGEVVAQFFTHHQGFRGGLNISTVPVF